MVAMVYQALEVVQVVLAQVAEVEEDPILAIRVL
jgi:hypothetical protein